jgi:hypothetical protein
MRFRRMSLRGLLAFVTCVALVIVSLKYASPVWQAVVGFALIVAIGAAVISSIFDRGPRQAFALGFCLATFGYGILLLSTPKTTDIYSIKRSVEFSQVQGQLPTTLLLYRIYRSVQGGVYVEHETGKAHPSTTPLITDSAGNQTIGGKPVGFMPIPDSEDFMHVGHYWWALLFGYLGGSFAQFVYERRKREQSAAV